MEDDLLEMLPELVTECLEALDAVEGALLELDAAHRRGAPAVSDDVNQAFRGMHTFKGIAGFIEVESMVSIAHAAETRLDELRESADTMGPALLQALCESVDLLRLMTQATLTGTQPEELLQRGTELLDTLTEESSRPSTPPAPSTTEPKPKAVHVPPPPRVPPPPSRPPVPAPPPVQSVPKPPSPTPPAPSSPAREGAIRVSVRKLNELVNLVGELIISENALLHTLDAEGAEAAEPLHRITRDLQDLAMSIRMVPLQSTFRRIRRVATDLTRKHGKKLELTLEGEETEVDKTVIEAIADPLLHLIRNACDHGLATPQVRRSQGKPETGQLRLTARHESGEVHICVEDDGSGLDTDRILQKAWAAGLVQQGHRPPTAAIHQLIFAPGLSTNETVTDLSGRGVGMDVVLRSVEAVGGSISIDSEPGRGTRFLIRLPLTLAILDGMLLRRGVHTLAIPLTGIRELVPLDPAAIFALPGGGYRVDLLGQTLPLLEPAPELGAHDDGGLLVVLEDNHRLVALRTDALVGQQQIVVKPMPPALGRQFGWSGCTILPSGEIGLLLDVKAVVDRGVAARPTPGTAHAI